MDITFCGAARTVTGSSFMLEHEGFSVLIDLGLPQGSDEKKLGLDLPFSPSAVDAVILTHAHIDHSGRLPLLAKLGYTGPIYSTSATMELAGIMLEDSAHIQESEAEWKSRKRLRHGEEAVEPLYETADAEAALALFRPVGYGERVDLTPSLWFEMKDAGHLLGSASVRIHCLLPEGGERTIVFSGDIGNFDQPMIRDPDYFHEADFVVMESTYGDRLHEKNVLSLMDRAGMLAEITDRTFRRGGKLIIPSFAVGRTQEILYLYRLIIDHGLLDYSPQVFLDSPLAVRATSIFRDSIRGDYFDDEAMDLVERGLNPVDFPSLIKTQDVKDSMALNSRKEPCVIISSSGMCDAGRIKHHLKHNLWKPECTVLFVGYQAEGTLGRNIADGARHVTIFGEQIDVKAEIASLPGLSGHADMNGLMTWIKAFREKPGKVFVVHGDENVAPQFALKLAKEGFNACAPELLDSFDLAADLPEQKTAVWVDRNEKIISTACQRLDSEKARIDKLLGRFKFAVSALDMNDKDRVTRLANAITRLASDLDNLSDKWNSDPDE